MATATKNPRKVRAGKKTHAKVKLRTEKGVRVKEAYGMVEILGIVQELVSDYHITHTAGLLRALQLVTKTKGLPPVQSALDALAPADSSRPLGLLFKQNS